MIQRFASIIGWSALAFIAFTTLSPIRDRPVLADAHLEHFAAFAIMGLAFSLGAPRRTLLIAAMMIVSAVALESLQLLTPDRHGRLLDAFVKAIGGICGVGVSRLDRGIWRARVDRIRDTMKSRPGTSA